MSTIPCPGVVQLDLRTKLEISVSDEGLGIGARISERSLLNGNVHTYRAFYRPSKEAAVLALIVGFSESGIHLTSAASGVLKEIGRYAVERLCQSLGDN